MDLLSENRKLLPTLCPGLWRSLESLPPSPYRLEPSRQGPPTVRYGPVDRTVYLHSRYDPLAEASRIVAAADLNAEHLVVLGLGLGYHLMTVMESKPPETRVLLVEPDLELVRLSLATVPWGALLKRSDFFFALGGDPGAISSAIPAFVDLVSCDRVETIELAPEVRLAERFFSQARRTIDAEVRTLLIDFQTRLVEDSMVPRNVLKNLPRALDARPLAALRGRFAGVPGIIVSAGPSLDQNVLQLRRLNDRAVTIAVDTALKPLLARGIQPHFTAVADPSYKNYVHLLGTAGRLKHFVIAEMGVAGRVFTDFQGRLFTAVLDNPLTRMIESASQPIGKAQAWGSVISMALDLAVQLGLDPIVFIGQDFAFTGMRNHCRHTSWEENWLATHHDPGALENKERESIIGTGRLVEQLDVRGQPVLSSERLVLYKNYLLKLLREVPGRRFINATEGGILTEIETRPLAWVMREFVAGRPPLDLACLDRIPTLGVARHRSRLKSVLLGKAAFFEQYRQAVLEMKESLDLALGGSEDPDRLLERADRVKGRLYDVPQNGELLEMWSQAPIFRFLKQSRQLAKRNAGTREVAAAYRDYFDHLAPKLAKVAAALDRAGRELAGAGGEGR